MAAPILTLLTRPLCNEAYMDIMGPILWDEEAPHTCYYAAQTREHDWVGLQSRHHVYAIELPHGVPRKQYSGQPGQSVRAVWGPYLVLTSSSYSEEQIEVVRKDTGRSVWRLYTRASYVSYNEQGVVARYRDEKDGETMHVHAWEDGAICASIPEIPSVRVFGLGRTVHAASHEYTRVDPGMGDDRQVFSLRYHRFSDTGVWVEMPYPPSPADGDATMWKHRQYFDMDGKPIVRPEGVSIGRPLLFYRHATRTCVWESSYERFHHMERLDEHNWGCARGTMLSPSTEFVIMQYPRHVRAYSTTGRRDALQARVRAAYLEGLASCKGMHRDQAVAVLKYLPSEWWGWED